MLDIEGKFSEFNIPVDSSYPGYIFLNMVLEDTDDFQINGQKNGNFWSGDIEELEGEVITMTIEKKKMPVATGGGVSNGQSNNQSIRRGH